MNTARGMVKFTKSQQTAEAAFKAPGFEGYLTRGEVARKVGRDKKRLSQLEKELRIPAPIRVPHGKIKVRLYSPKQVANIERWFEENGVPQRGRRYRK